MPKHVSSAACGSILLVLACASVAAGPVTGEEAARQKAVIDTLKASVEAARDDAGKLAAFEAAARDASVEVRRRVVELAADSLPRDRDAFFQAVLKGDPDAGIRAQAAKALGRVGSAGAIPALAAAAKGDPETTLEIGCILSRGSARREATFALADLAGRFPKSADAVAAELRKLAPADEQDRHAVQAALYRVTRDPAVLAPVLRQLDDAQPQRRRDAVVQLQYFGLKSAPPELVKRLEDPDEEVQSWTALALGDVGDAAAVPALLAAATDAKRGHNTRCNAIVSLGRLKAADAAAALERLRDDPDPTVSTQAAAAVEKLNAAGQAPPPKSPSPAP